MATMLAVILTDCRVEPSFLRESIGEAAEMSFNAITVDGDSSTNDTLLALAGGPPERPKLGRGKEDRGTFASMLRQACTDLARQIVADGEGATKLVEVRVCGARDKKAATRIARTIAESALVKTAFYGQDPNWGRIIAAAGRAGVEFDPTRLELLIGDVQVVTRGAPVSGDWEQRAGKVMREREFSVLLDLKSGDGEASLLTTDLSEEYVRINAAYRT
jgi:glutamate N-acetyltransferase/amino-acid N-acetyltransferase